MAAVLAGANAQEESGLVPVALDFVARATSTSEVLTLNLTNLLILIVLKALIFGAGIFLQGASSTARSAEETSITETDLTGGMCFLMYTSGAEDKLSCVQRTACDDVATAKQYYQAGKMWYNMHLALGMDFPEKYMTALNAVKVAADHGAEGGDCHAFQW